MSVQLTAVRPAKDRRRTRPIAPFDKRTRTGRRASELAKVYAACIGESANDPITETAIRRASELRALSEALRARALRGDEMVSADDIVRVERLAEQAERALRLDQRERERERVPSLADYLKQQHAPTAEDEASAA
jgi:hypothetical protein